MIKTVAMIALGIGAAFTVPSGQVLAAAPLRPTSPAQLQNLGFDGQLWGQPGHSGDKQTLLKSVDHSLRYLQTAEAGRKYRQYPVPGVSRDRVRRSLERFRQLLIQSRSPAELQAAMQREFVFFQAAGQDNQGTVAFTGYFEPTYKASRVPTAEYRYPIYRLPADFQRWPKPNPTRAQLEGADALQGPKGRLRGLELVWLRDRLEAFLIQVQGSARLQLTDGSTLTVGFAGKTDQPYSSAGKELVKDGKFTLAELTLPKLMQYFQDHPAEMSRYLPRNRSFVFFRETNGAPPTGSLGVPVTAERSIATDKSVMPPGALALVQTQIPCRRADGQFAYPNVSRYVLDQDTGSAIKGAGRVDVFMGTGPEAGQRAGLMNSTGELYYLLLKQ